MNWTTEQQIRLDYSEPEDQCDEDFCVEKEVETGKRCKKCTLKENDYGE